MEKVWEYVEYGIYDYGEFCETKIFATEEKAKEYFKEKVEKEKLKINSYNFYSIQTNFEECGDGDFYITSDNDYSFSGYEVGYSMEYSINMYIKEKECN